MDSLGIEYKIIPADIDEKSIRDEDLVLRAEKIARGKAEEVAKNNQGIIVAADTFLTCQGKVLEKPKDVEEAKEMLKMERNQKIMIYTGFCYLDKKNEIDFSKTAISELTLRDINDMEIENFVKSTPVLQWSAAFCPMYTYQSTFIKNIKGSFTGVFGLPIEFLEECLEKSGVEIRGSGWKE